MPTVKSIDIAEAKKAVKKCPEIVRDYVRSLEGLIETKDHFRARAIKKIKELSAEINELKSTK